MGACTPVGVGEVREMLGKLRRQEMGNRGDHAGRRMVSCRFVVDYLSISGAVPAGGHRAETLVEHLAVKEGQGADDLV